MLFKTALLGLITLIVFGFFALNQKDFRRTPLDLNYVITETGAPDSWDPLNADKTQNINSMRMVYATPIEIGKNNTLISQLLSSFVYDSKSKSIIFIVRENLKFENGQPLEPNDIAISIARMAYFKPTFPVIKDIKGISDWIASGAGLQTLPSGVSIEGPRITIQLMKGHINPLFRFCLELFSVIPHGCINLKSGDLTCEKPSPSGYYRIKEFSPNQINFERRDNLPHLSEEVPYNKINFKFMKLSEACKTKVDSSTVISGNEIDLLSSGCDVAHGRIHWLPSARFSVLRFNPNIEVFNTPYKRQLFAKMVRASLTKKNSSLMVERGLFSKLLPGYIPSDQIESIDNFELRKSFVGKHINLPHLASSGMKVVYEAINEAAVDLGMTVDLVTEPINKEIIKNFLNGNFPIIAGASGFWAQDPIGDISMWFTPNLHDTMTFAWADKEIYERIHKMENATDEKLIKELMLEFNSYISEKSVLLPVIHFRRFYILGNEDTPLYIPQAVTSPAPWQIAIDR